MVRVVEPQLEHVWDLDSKDFDPERALAYVEIIEQGTFHFIQEVQNILKPNEK